MKIHTHQIPKIGKIKVSLDATIGIAQSRGERPYQEDFVALSSLTFKHKQLTKTITRAQDYQKLIANNQAKFRKRIVPSTSNNDTQDFQSLFVAVIDGHGGTDSAKYLSNNLSRIITETDPIIDIPKAIREYRSIGGYFRRFRGGYLEELANQIYLTHPQKSSSSTVTTEEKEKEEELVIGIDERIHLSYLLADQDLIKTYPKSGAVMTSIIMTSLPVEESPESGNIIYPYFQSTRLSLVVAHVGDTVALLCSADDGKVSVLTENHHPDSRVESDRLRRIGTGLITDSFGESRWGGSLANSRGLGDAAFKGLGVTGEPDIINKIINGKDWEFLILVSDGISNMLTNQEIIDLCKQIKSPKDASKKVVEFAESLGGRDNMTAIVIPLYNWNNPDSIDHTVQRREFRLNQIHAQTGSARQNRM
ncbi:hypothetical protein PSTG_10236 [Puccinia striiformis f. sp. tritici PST-78]|uniref:PPM-type phosphatase domain-containing protein n=1 Tax=Puccinia striiformis f. sp. tritici PST-78 TaxID=1165861 RepID=A0A0L0VB93_9BASI|nr:hypothetical protein PSTG_10236 [Puccinia striiformis f. sp. tritici PST-78]